MAILVGGAPVATVVVAWIALHREVQRERAEIVRTLATIQEWRRHTDSQLRRIWELLDRR